MGMLTVEVAGGRRAIDQAQLALGLAPDAPKVAAGI